MSQRMRFHRAKIVVLGGSGAGKTAFVVRYLTRRFIGEYENNKENFYTHKAMLDKDEVTVEIVDTASGSEESLLESHIKWADGFLLMYSVTDKHSFNRITYYHSLVQHVIRHHDDLDCLPVVVVGNKADLPYARAVTAEEAESLAQKLDCPHFEVSVADSPEGANHVMDGLLHHIKHEFLKSVHGLSKTASAFSNVKRVFKKKMYRSRSDTLQ